METELRLFKEKAITLPNNMLVKKCDEHTLLDTALLSRPLKMVVYVNKNGCTDCKLRALLPINMFILENRKNENFGVIIIINTPDVEITEYILAEMNFCQTVFYDLDGSFERANPHLPMKEQFHIFLLNEENNVMLVGNPTHNGELKKLYLVEMNK